MAERFVEGLKTFAGWLGIYNAYKHDYVNDKFANRSDTVTHYASAAKEKSKVVSTNDGEVYNVAGHNDSTARFVHVFFGVSSVPANGTAPDVRIYAGANSDFSWPLKQGVSYTTGFVVAASTTLETLTLDTGDNTTFQVEYEED